MAPANASVLGSAFDPEGIVVNPRNGNLLVSDEYGPSVYEFTRNGELVRQYNTPANLVPKVGANANFNADPITLTSGREGNRGLEGLAISPDGRYAFAMLQNGTVTDGNLNAAGTALDRGMYTRIVKYDTETGEAVGQYAYRLDGAGPAPAQGRGISAIVALDEDRFMVLERNNRGVGVPNANIASPDKKIYIIDISNADDVTGIDLDTLALPAGIDAVTKEASALINLAAASTLADPSLAAMGGRSPEKWEGLTVGPQLLDGSFMLLAGTDNDYSVTQNGSNVQFDVYYNPTTGARVQCDLGGTTNCFNILANGNVENVNLGDLPSGFALIPGVLHAYKASIADLGGYQAPVPEPETYAMMVAGLGLLGLVARRRKAA
ncbi:MAG: PEP-CTERM sorting domain-containing protein [Burkholderiales bacterium 12-64-5]|nr:MAG: PEP-CTERM sorting domain-containing protein [Burkholderiales bacterium 12-64-5]